MLDHNRFPAPHATTHKRNGSDEILLDELGLPLDVTNLNASNTRHGLLLKLTDVTNQFLRADGQWAVPPATGGGGADATAWHNTLDTFGALKKFGTADNYPIEMYAHNTLLFRVFDVCDSGTNPYYCQFQLNRNDNSLIGSINTDGGNNAYAGFEAACTLDYGKVMAILHTGAGYSNVLAPEVAANEGSIVLGLNSAQMNIRCNGSQPILFHTNHKQLLKLIDAGTMGGQLQINRDANTNVRWLFASNANSGSSAKNSIYLESDTATFELGVVSSTFAASPLIAGDAYIQNAIGGTVINSKGRFRLMIDAAEYLVAYPAGGTTAYKMIVGDVSGRPTLLSNGSGNFIVNGTAPLVSEFILLNSAGLGGIRLEGKVGFSVAPVVQQTVNAITNSVTAGGTDAIIADFTSLTIYASDATTIRNDIYQLARSVSQIAVALRNYGLAV